MACGEVVVEGRSVPRVANPRDTESALNWQLERIGSAAWLDWPLKFQRMAFGYANDSGWHDAADAVSWLDHHKLLREGQAPRGALVWYHAGDRIRVACSLGSGQVVGPLLTGPVEVALLTSLSTDYVWSDPHFPFGH
ncbi:hypothetical protein PWY87_19120 [Kribbella solani]|uniref:hypothetical protein n=1 Tax=Kribbella solani TaxID=236067 RepID=UPI0029BD3F55|nr:hypothetical protein [Kribbella solani]MDX2974453.1 hypothetical protein [Kribbella solani]MDX3003808.1 hypothetical protein [Kribbella solani]